ncbi:MAG: hypothetical protein K0S47_2463 [Herbinix sp.]|jgi:uncharacterized membrane protein|nr:hypothetical protein [Herbinix sp.]
MKSKHLIKLVTAALMAAMTCMTTMVVPIPSPTGGFIHPGDGFVLLSGIILGPFYGGLAAGIGSMFADIFLGYTIYAPATLIIKALAAVTGALIYRHVRKYSVILAGIAGGIVVTSGYLLFESMLLGNGLAAAVVGVPGNIVQNIFGIVLSSLLLPLLKKVPQIRSVMDK